MAAAWKWLWKSPGAAGGRQRPRGILLVQVLWLLILGGIFFAYVKSPDVRHDVHTGWPIPVEVVWFGALGGCLYSFDGIFNNSATWDTNYNAWHLTRPLLGAATGGAACVLLLSILRAASGSGAHTDAAVFYSAAFLFGYAESAFRQLVKAATDVVLKPGGSGTTSDGSSRGGGGGSSSSAGGG